MLSVHPLELLRIEDGGLLVQAVHVEQLDHLGGRHQLDVIARRPAKECQEVQHRAGQNAQVLVVANRRGTVSLAQLLAVHAMDHRQVGEFRQRRTERLVQEDLLRSIGDVIVSAHHERDRHRDVVADDGHVVDRRTVCTEDDEVLDVLVGKGDGPVDSVVPARTALGDTKAHGEGHALGKAALDLVGREVIASPIVAERLLRRLSGRAPLRELLLRAEAPVRGTALEQAHSVLTMALEIRRLVHHRLVPGEAEPLQPLENCPGARVGGARLVRVLHAQQELSADLASVQPIEQRGARPTDMQVAGGGRREPETRDGDGISHGNCRDAG